MRMIAMLVLGLAIGVFGSVTMLSAMRQQTPLPRAVMALSGHHFGALRTMHESGRCETDRATARLHSLRTLAGDIEPAFLPTGGDDELFLRHGREYAQRLDSALAAPPATCEALKSVIGSLGSSCKACHQDFKP
jgi:cytochrome c556